MLHVAMVVRSFSPFGGLELYTYKLVGGLLKCGVKVTVICERSDLEPVHANLRVCNFAPPQAHAKKSARIKHYYREASDAVDKFGPFDIIHTQHLPIRKADVVTFHNHTVFRLSKVGQRWERLLNDFKICTSEAYKLRNELDQQLSNTTRGLVFTSHACKEDFRDTYKLPAVNPQALYTVAYPGADLNTTAPDYSLGRQQDRALPFTFLFVGKGYRKKGLDVLFNACRILRNKNKLSHLLIAGLRPKAFDNIHLATIGLSSYVTYLGFQEDMEAVYVRSSAIILPSRVEPFGMAPLQGMLRGLVPIVSKVSGIAEIITNKYDGLILENHLNAEELANHMSSLIDNPNLVTMLSTNAIATAKSYTWDKTVDTTIEVYDSLLNSTSCVPCDS